MLTEPYTPQEITNATRDLKNRKAFGIGGAPGDVYKALGDWVTKPITDILQEIQKCQELPPEWKQGEVVHIYKNKGSAQECKNYRPICLALIEYKIRPIIIAR